MNKTLICHYASCIAVISIPTTAPYSSGGSGLNDAGFQIMSKQSTAQGRVKKPDKNATGGTPEGLNDAGFQIMSKHSTALGRVKKPDKSAPGDMPDEQAPEVRTPDAPKMEVLLATMLAKIDEKFD